MILYTSYKFNEPSDIKEFVMVPNSSVYCFEFRLKMQGFDNSFEFLDGDKVTVVLFIDKHSLES